MPPSLFPRLEYDHALDRFFLSDDGALHKLRVETYGGASWVNEFALLTGISTKAFGDMRMFVHVLMGGRLKETLPQTLAKCGYRTLMLFPMKKGYLSLDRFYRSIGFTEILDRRDQGAPTIRERDRFYFQNALEAMDRHFKSSDQPLFVYIQTMASHGPYDSAYMPEENVPGGGPGTSAEMSEYLRRAAMAQRDGGFLMDEIKRRFPGESILVVRYGDHQPSATRDIINDVWGDDSPDVGPDGSPGPFITFYGAIPNGEPGAGSGKTAGTYCSLPRSPTRRLRVRGAHGRQGAGERENCRDGRCRNPEGDEQRVNSGVSTAGCVTLKTPAMRPIEGYRPYEPEEFDEMVDRVRLQHDAEAEDRHEVESVEEESALD